MASGIKKTDGKSVKNKIMKKRKELTTKQQKAIAVIAFFSVIIVTGLIIWRVGVPLVRFAREPEQFREWVADHGYTGKLAYMGMVFMQVLIAVLPGEPFEIAGGYAFGALWGTVLSLIPAFVASVLIFMLVRRFGVRFVEIFFPKEKIESLRFLKTNKKRNLIFFIIFLIPGTPKDLLCYFAGLTDMDLGLWMLISILGRIPSVFTSTVGGDAIAKGHYSNAVVVFIITFLLSAVCLLAYYLICKHLNIAEDAKMTGKTKK